MTIPNIPPNIRTPAYVLDVAALKRNLATAARIKEQFDRNQIPLEEVLASSRIEVAVQVNEFEMTPHSDARFESRTVAPFDARPPSARRMSP